MTEEKKFILEGKTNSIVHVRGVLNYKKVQIS